MLTQCPKCGSTEIIPDLILWGCDQHISTTFAVLVNPQNRQPGFKTGFRVSVCGACGYTELFTNFGKELLEYHRKGFVTAK